MPLKLIVHNINNNIIIHEWIFQLIHDSKFSSVKSAVGLQQLDESKECYHRTYVIQNW